MCWIFEHDKDYKAFLELLLPIFIKFVDDNPIPEFSSLIDWVYFKSPNNRDLEINLLNTTPRPLKNIVYFFSILI